MSNYDNIMAYHEATKHHFNWYARSAGYMDWQNQPNPFRRYEGAEQIRLPLNVQDPDLDYGGLYTPLKDQGAPLTRSAVGAFCAFAMGLSAWKQAGASRWSLRINPSSGNLHPTEAYLVLPDMAKFKGGLFHYAPLTHALEHRAHYPTALGSPLQAHFGPGFGVALTAIFWRESWKYGERAYRYCCLDAGHALAALAYAARLFNWQCVAIGGAGDDQLEALLGMDRTAKWPLEREAAEMFCWIAVQPKDHPVPQHLPDALVRPLAKVAISGHPNKLSSRAQDWDIIEQAADATRKSATAPLPLDLPNKPLCYKQPMTGAAAGVIRQRRSAVKFDPKGYIDKKAFLAILDPTLARAGIPPFGVNLMAPAVNLVLFIHRVKHMDPGLYLLARAAVDITALQTTWRSDFRWQPAADDLPLYQLLPMDVTYDAMELSCHQEIAGHSAFAVAMLAPLKACLQQAPHLYRHLHWECGMIGQVLYLGAEAHGLRGTGIGCFFDDEVHRLLGIDGNRFQSLYHFTVGHPVEDDRLTTLPAYHHLIGNR